MAYSFDLVELNKRIANNINAIFRGAKPAIFPFTKRSNSNCRSTLKQPKSRDSLCRPRFWQPLTTLSSRRRESGVSAKLPFTGQAHCISLLQVDASEGPHSISVTKGPKATTVWRRRVNRNAVGHLKRILRLDRLRLRGPFGARDEFLLAATAQNLRKLAKLILPPALKPA